MRIIKHNGREVRLRENDWRKLTKRFDATRAKFEEEDGTFNIWVGCSLCDRYTTARDCGECPLREFELLDEMGDSTQVGCLRVILDILYDHHYGRMCFDVQGGSHVEWNQVDDPTARDQLRVIYNRLQSMKKEV